MKRYTFKKAIKKVPGSKNGDQLILSSGFVQDLKEEIEAGDIEIQNIELIHEMYDGQDLNNKKLLLFRAGGYGDILFATPLVRYLKNRYPDAKIHFACSHQYQMVWARNKDIVRFGVHDYPIFWRMLEGFDYHIHFDGLIENNPEAEEISAYDLFFKQAGIDYKSIDPSEKLPIYYPDSYAQNKIKNYLRYTLGLQRDSRLVAIQAKASSAVRTPDPSVFFETAFKLRDNGYHVAMLGGRMDIPVGIEIDGIYNLAGRLKMTDSVALLTFCDLVITPDSSLVHFAAALDVPCLSIYGPFPASVRTSYYPKNVSLEPPDEPDKCWPCFCHERVCPKAEERTYISPCLHRNKISSDTVSNTALGMLGRSVPIETGITTGINSDINKRSVSGMHETVYC